MLRARESFLVHILQSSNNKLLPRSPESLIPKWRPILRAYPHEIVIHNTLLRFTSPLYYDALLLPRILMVTWINWWWDPSLTTNLFSDFSDNKKVTGLSWTTSKYLETYSTEERPLTTNLFPMVFGNKKVPGPSLNSYPFCLLLVDWHVLQVGYISFISLLALRLSAHP